MNEKLEIKRGWTTEDLVKNFRDININRIAQLRTGYLKKNKFDEIKKVKCLIGHYFKVFLFFLIENFLSFFSTN